MTSAEKLAVLCEEAQNRGWQPLEVTTSAGRLGDVLAYDEHDWRADAALIWVEDGRASAILTDHAFWEALLPKKGSDWLCRSCGRPSHSTKGCTAGWNLRPWEYHVGECARQSTLEARIDYAYAVADKHVDHDAPLR